MKISNPALDPRFREDDKEKHFHTIALILYWKHLNNFLFRGMKLTNETVKKGIDDKKISNTWIFESDGCAWL